MLRQSGLKKTPVKTSRKTHSDAATSVKRNTFFSTEEKVLIYCDESRWAVNKEGFPRGEGSTFEEQSGPYCYVLATVKRPHFGEDRVYYTVTREDMGIDQRADAGGMLQIKNPRAENAALNAARKAQEGIDDTEDAGKMIPKTKCFDIFENVICLPLTPLLWLLECFANVIGKRLCQFGASTLASTRYHGRLFLNGSKPYSCSINITMINILVVCSSWYLFIDQARLAFLPENSDESLAIVSFIVWIILVIELFCEIFIRPDGYNVLIGSEKAYSPMTVRYINYIHLVVESISLALFMPEFICLFASHSCGERFLVSYFDASYKAILGENRSQVFYGRLYLAQIRFRVFGLVRHWRIWWVNKNFVAMRQKSKKVTWLSEISTSGQRDGAVVTNAKLKSPEEEKSREEALINASNIGTALMVTNSHRCLLFFCTIIGLFPLFGFLNANGVTNQITSKMTKQLEKSYEQFANASSPEECDFFVQSVRYWMRGLSPRTKSSISSTESAFLLKLDIDSLSIPCTNKTDIMEWVCQDNSTLNLLPCHSRKLWKSPEGTEAFAMKEGIRTGAIIVERNIYMNATFNHSSSISAAARSSFFLQLCLLISILLCLSIMRHDSAVFAFGPLRRMLKIVAQYAKNPLASVKNNNDDSDDDKSENGDQGDYETEHLISAVSKITDLLRKCWGVAGADIISTNLATQEGALTEVFNPTVPGKSVYALFGFAAINAFDYTLRQLQGDVMILINDVATVLHGEVFRWAFGDSGQCNKNLGAAFLMVFRIGSVEDVIQKLEKATDFIYSTTTTTKPGIRKRNKNAKKQNNDQFAKFSKTGPRSFNNRRRKSQRIGHSNRKAPMSLSLQSLPGISTFTDRAVIGMLKSFAGIYRDNKLLEWKNDFRLGAGVGTFSVNMIFGMDAGWAVEGAVGSEYKIDATYLSPHVNMASRMMSACKQYGVSILLSQAVEELMSEIGQSKLRHLDTVTVKGSSLKQKIFTYDARHKGVDFFLYQTTEEQADRDSENYSPNIWTTDQDLTGMRQHITEDFEEEFTRGRDAYLAGDWPEALKHLKSANEIMVENVMDQGYMQDDGEAVHAAEEELRHETEDGPSCRLISFMERLGNKVPESWEGYRPLTSK